MEFETGFVFALLFTTIILFISDRIRVDAVAILVIIALLLSGILSPKDAVAGFGNPLIILIAGLFIVGEGLLQTGVVYTAVDWMVSVAGSNRTRLTVLLMLSVALVSAVMSSTGAVAIFIPVVLSLAARTGANPKVLLIPLAFASLMGGMLTLIGTPPNLVVSNQLEAAGLNPFGFFSFVPIGLPILIVGILYMLFFGQKLLAKDIETTEATPSFPSVDDLRQRYGISNQFKGLRVNPGSSLIGETVSSAKLRNRFNTTAIALARKRKLTPPIMPVLISTKICAGDELFVLASDADVAVLIDTFDLKLINLAKKQTRALSKEIGLAEVMLSPTSKMIGRTIKGAQFLTRYGLSVVAVDRKNQLLEGNIINHKLQFGDTMLVCGGWGSVDLLRSKSGDFLVLNLPKELSQAAPTWHHASIAVGILVAMTMALTFKLLPAVTAVLIAAVAMVASGCIKSANVYKSVNWQSLVVIAGMLPMATALQQTGGIELIVNLLINSIGTLGPTAMMAGLFIITSVFSQFISNTATTVLVAPIAIATASAVGYSPYPMLMTVAIAASTAFATPVASPVNTLVLGPGQYKFIDFVKVGVPLQIIAMILTLLLMPLMF